ncbi:MAG: hypothetical protein CMF62_02110 [Magnetococcales bacterium]|nr:hypothetical protein [Magnetococcales bacterium]|tara:strand:+ start:159210 stop:159659 length:450 start_codon:yes stop_codon:yes gene_type:complete
MDDIFEFLEDYTKNLITTFDLKIFLKEITNIITLIPEMFTKIYKYLSELFQKLFIKLRTRIIFSITKDIDLIDQDQELWIKLNISLKKNLKILQLLSERSKVLKRKSIYNKIKIMLQNQEKKEFLKYCSEKQLDNDFILIKQQLNNITN